MAEDTMVKEIIAAYALGCLDKNNFERVVEFLQADKFPSLDELGTIQNVVSLIPLTLNPESPRAELALELSNKIDIILTEMGIEPTGLPEPKEEIEISIERNETIEEEVVEVFKGEKAILESNESSEQDSDTSMFKPLITETKSKRNKLNLQQKDLIGNVKGKKYLYIAIGSILIAVFSIILLVVLLNSSSGKITDLEKKLSILESQSNTSNAFMKNYQKYFSFISQGGISVTSISDSNGFITAKMHVSEITGNGLVEIISMPIINSNEVFRVYAVSNGNSVPVGAFIINDKVRFSEINNIKTDIYFKADLIKVIIEEKNGKSSESKMVFYGGKPTK